MINFNKIYQHVLPIFEVLYLCGFHGNPSFYSFILPEIIVLNTLQNMK